MAPSEKDLTSLCKDIYSAINRNDLNRFSGYLADNVEVVDQTSGNIHRGPRETVNFYRGFLSTFPDAQVDIDRQTAAGSTVINEITIRGSHQGPLPGPDGNPVAATGRKVQFPCCEVWEFQGDKVTGIHLYADYLAVLQQLGLVPRLQARAAQDRREWKGTDQDRPQPRA